MKSKALIIGVDDYVQQPLTSSVNDALAFRRALLELGVVEPGGIHLLTSPCGPESQGPADSDHILNALDYFYRHGGEVDRLFFYFAGHGILAYAAAAHNRTRTVVVPADVEDLEQHGRKLIDFDELLQLYSQAGPEQQLFFVDACRDLPYEKLPDVAGLGLSGVTPGERRRQAALFAVSPLGKAVATRGGMGHFTKHLLESFRRETMAFDYDPVEDKYVVTMHSAHAYVYEKVLHEAAGEPVVNRRIGLPELRAGHPAPDPIVAFDDVDPVSFTVHIDPDTAERDTSVKLFLNRAELGPNYCYPLNRNHSAVNLQPQRHLVVASSNSGVPHPQRAVVDVRRLREHLIRVRPPLGWRTETVPDSGIVPPEVTAAPTAPTGEELGRESRGEVEAVGVDAEVKIGLHGLNPPYAEWTGIGGLHVKIPPGPYRIDFRLGDEVFSQSDIYVQPGSTCRAYPRAAVTPLVQEALGMGEIPGRIGVSESTGGMQSGVLATILPVIGIKTLDVRNQVFGRFAGMVQVSDPDEFSGRPVAVVIAIDGNGWKTPADELIESVWCTIGAGGRDEHLRLRAPGRGTLFGGPEDHGVRGFNRIRYGVAEAPSFGTFSISIRVQAGEQEILELTSASVPNRATVVNVAFRPDGSVDVGQSLSLFPGTSAGSGLVYAKHLRLLQIAQKLYRAGELAEYAVTGRGEMADALRGLLVGRWADPLLNCMMFYALSRSRGGADSRFLESLASNAYRRFEELPDAQIVRALLGTAGGAETLGRLLSKGTIPLLSESAHVLAAHAVEAGQPYAPIVDVARRMVPGQPWCQLFREEIELAGAVA